MARKKSALAEQTLRKGAEEFAKDIGIRLRLAELLLASKQVEPSHAALLEAARLCRETKGVSAQRLRKLQDLQVQLIFV